MNGFIGGFVAGMSVTSMLGLLFWKDGDKPVLVTMGVVSGVIAILLIRQARKM